MRAELTTLSLLPKTGIDEVDGDATVVLRCLERLKLAGNTEGPHDGSPRSGASGAAGRGGAHAPRLVAVGNQFVDVTKRTQRGRLRDEGVEDTTDDTLESVSAEALSSAAIDATMAKAALQRLLKKAGISLVELIEVRRLNTHLEQENTKLKSDLASLRSEMTAARAELAEARDPANAWIRWHDVWTKTHQTNQAKLVKQMMQQDAIERLARQTEEESSKNVKKIAGRLQRIRKNEERFMSEFEADEAIVNEAIAMFCPVPISVGSVATKIHPEGMSPPDGGVAATVEDAPKEAARVDGGDDGFGAAVSSPAPSPKAAVGEAMRLMSDIMSEHEEEDNDDDATMIRQMSYGNLRDQLDGILENGGAAGGANEENEAQGLDNLIVVKNMRTKMRYVSVMDPKGTMVGILMLLLTESLTRSILLVVDMETTAGRSEMMMRQALHYDISYFWEHISSYRKPVANILDFPMVAPEALVELKQRDLHITELPPTSPQWEDADVTGMMTREEFFPGDHRSSSANNPACRHFFKNKKKYVANEEDGTLESTDSESASSDDEDGADAGPTVDGNKSRPTTAGSGKGAMEQHGHDEHKVTSKIQKFLRRKRREKHHDEIISAYKRVDQRIASTISKTIPEELATKRRQHPGMINYVGKEFGRSPTWTSPINNNEIKVFASSMNDSCKPDAVIQPYVDPRLPFFITKDEPGQWVMICFTNTVVLPWGYSFASTHPIRSGLFPISWRVEGSMDGISFFLLRRHVNDPSLSKNHPLGIWELDTKPVDYVRYIRLVQEGRNSMGSYHFNVSSLEVYGRMLYAEPFRQLPVRRRVKPVPCDRPKFQCFKELDPPPQEVDKKKKKKGKKGKK